MCVKHHQGTASTQQSQFIFCSNQLNISSSDKVLTLLSSLSIKYLDMISVSARFTVIYICYQYICDCSLILFPLSSPQFQLSGLDIAGQKGLPPAGFIFSQYSLPARALTQGFVWSSRPPAQARCFSLPAGSRPRSELSSSATALEHNRSEVSGLRSLVWSDLI